MAKLKIRAKVYKILWVQVTFSLKSRSTILSFKRVWKESILILKTHSHLNFHSTNFIVLMKLSMESTSLRLEDRISNCFYFKFQDLSSQIFLMEKLNMTLILLMNSADQISNNFTFLFNILFLIFFISLFISIFRFLLLGLFSYNFSRWYFYFSWLKISTVIL